MKSNNLREINGCCFSLLLFFFSFIQVDECENLPKNMCDSCIIQLNVAYNLKKNAIQSDLKLRQYMIEYGMNVTSYTACSINTVSVIRPPAILAMPASTTSESVTITTAKSTTVGPAVTIPPIPQPPSSVQQQQLQKQQQLQPQPPPPPPPPSQHRPFRVMPVIIKEEPVDYEVMSDITVETNAEAFEQRNGHHQHNGHHHTNGIRSTVSTTSSTNSNKSLTPLPIHSMVSINPAMVSINPANSKSLLVSTQTASDSEYISAYILTPSGNANKSAKSAAPTRAATKRVSPNSISLAVPKSKEKQALKTSTPLPSIPSTQQNKQRTTNSTTTSEKPNSVNSQSSPPSKRNREIDRLFDDSLIQNKSLNESAGRQTRQQLKTVEPNINGQSQQEQKPKQRSRSRNSTLKMDYKSFFSVRELKRRISKDNASRNVKKIGSAKTIVNKIKPTLNRKGASSTTQNRARI